MIWTTSEDLKSHLERRWQRGEFFSAYVRGQDLFPLKLRLKGPTPRDVAQHFGAVMDWVDTLEAGSRTARGYGYELEWERVRNRVQGGNDLPTAAIVPTEEDALRLIRRKTEAARGVALIATVIQRQPLLRSWLERRGLTILTHEDEWERLLAVLDWFGTHPRPGMYLRQLDIPGVDTKFIEGHRGILAELLDEVLPTDAIDITATGKSQFSQRYGLRSEPPQVRFRILDPSLYIGRLSDLAVPPEQFASLHLPVKRVFITENRVNGLAFPDHPSSLVIFGLGYGLERLAETPWLSNADVWYWGDIDTHGFGILNRLRAFLPATRSFLMDKETLEAHKALWGQEPRGKRYNGEPTHLTPDERSLYEALLHDELRERLRLEQERLDFSWLKRALQNM